MRELQIRPIPIPTEITQPYWDGAKKHQLMIQRCQRCKTYYHLPVASCAKCAGNEEAILCFEQVSGKGSVFTHTLIRDTRMKGFENIMPYPVVLVELAEQPRLIHYANMPTTNLEDIRIGRPVEVMFIEIGEGFTLPDFRLVTN